MFIAGGTAIDDDLLQRRVLMTIGVDPPVRLYVHTAEDILLQKLRWYRLEERGRTDSVSDLLHHAMPEK